MVLCIQLSALNSKAYAGFVADAFATTRVFFARSDEGTRRRLVQEDIADRQ
jgi:hypothetical protein